MPQLLGTSIPRPRDTLLFRIPGSAASATAGLFDDDDDDDDDEIAYFTVR